MRVIFAVLTTAFIIVLMVFLAVKLVPQPPVEEIETAMLSLSNASKREAPVYSGKLYAEAETAFDSAMAIWKRENSRFIFFRNYEKVSEYARLANKKAREAASSSVQNSNGLQLRIGEKLKSIEEISANIDMLFGRYPLEEEDRSRLSRGKLLLKEAEIAFDRKQLLQANRKINDAEYLINTVFENTLTDMKAWFGSFPVWRKWVDFSIAESRKNKSYLIIIDKYAHKCYVYSGGVKKYEFDAELGKNWTGNKRRMGDKATPEGIYKIVKKYQGRATPYYKSLTLDYPNSDDVGRFKKEIAEGLLPSSSKIGGGIEIHGGGGKGTDWTDGCIALTNKNMDIIYPMVRTGTSVIIVGSLHSLSDIMKSVSDERK
ncbi:MAG: L,D-transpeptidase family protein [Bacteroidales bacterium]